MWSWVQIPLQEFLAEVTWFPCGGWGSLNLSYWCCWSCLPYCHLLSFETLQTPCRVGATSPFSYQSHSPFLLWSHRYFWVDLSIFLVNEELVFWLNKAQEDMLLSDAEFNLRTSLKRKCLGLSFIWTDRARWHSQIHWLQHCDVSTTSFNQFAIHSTRKTWYPPSRMVIAVI
jgi:hypothetical protein